MEQWERLPGEPQKAWFGFVAYRDLGRDRSYARACVAMGRTPGYRKVLEKWSIKFGWRERVDAYDLHIDRLNRAVREQDKRTEYSHKIEKYREESERTGRAMVSLGAQAVTILQRELATRLRSPERLKPSEIATLMRASVMAIDVGSRLQSEALSIDQIASLLTEVASQN
ncbi:hypothetical protein H6G64_03895 [Calothrix sp. FACHB-156]|nr:hypothetical protein [Calothrix sp. FACHB-156]